MAKNKNPTINPALINLLSKLSVRVYFDNLPSAFKALYHSSPKVRIKYVIDPQIAQDSVKLKAADLIKQISQNVEKVVLPYGLNLDDVYYLYQICFLVDEQLQRTAKHRDVNVDYKKKHLVLEQLKLFKSMLDTRKTEIKKHSDIEFYKVIKPIASQVSITKDSYFYSLQKVDPKTVELVIKFNEVKPKSVNKGKLKRSVYPVVELFGKQPKNVIIEKGKMENAIPLPLYIQNHALHRLKSRIGNEFVDHLYESIIVSCTEQEFHKASPHTYLLAFRSNDVKLGYFTVTVETNIALIRSFKFITMVGTPEYDKLKKFIPTGSKIWQYLNLDSFDTIIESDIKNNAELYDIFKKCDLEYLFEYSKGNNISIANILLPYLSNH